MKILSETTELVGFFFQDLNFPDGYDEFAVARWFGVPYLRALLEKEIAAYHALQEWIVENLETATCAVGDELGLKFGDVIHPTRVAATGRAVGPGLFEALWALGKDRVLHRLRTVQTSLFPTSNWVYIVTKQPGAIHLQGCLERAGTGELANVLLSRHRARRDPVKL